MTAAFEPYTRCPDCGFIAPPESADYGVTGPGGEVDWTGPARVTCLICRARHDITAADVLPADGQMTCHRCATNVACPAAAARVRCTGCGLYLIGPGLTEPQRVRLCIAEGLSDLALRDRYLAAVAARPAR